MIFSLPFICLTSDCPPQGLCPMSWNLEWVGRIIEKQQGERVHLFIWKYFNPAHPCQGDRRAGSSQFAFKQTFASPAFTVQNTTWNWCFLSRIKWSGTLGPQIQSFASSLGSFSSRCLPGSPCCLRSLVKSKATSAGWRSWVFAYWVNHWRRPFTLCTGALSEVCRARENSQFSHLPSFRLKVGALRVKLDAVETIAVVSVCPISILNRNSKTPFLQNSLSSWGGKKMPYSMTFLLPESLWKSETEY